MPCHSTSNAKNSSRFDQNQASASSDALQICQCKNICYSNFYVVSINFVFKLRSMTRESHRLILQAVYGAGEISSRVASPQLSLHVTVDVRWIAYFCCRLHKIPEYDAIQIQNGTCDTYCRCKINYYPHYIFRLEFISSLTQQTTTTTAAMMTMLMMAAAVANCCYFVLISSAAVVVAVVVSWFAITHSLILTSGAIDSLENNLHVASAIANVCIILSRLNDGYTLQNYWQLSSISLSGISL